MATPAPTVVVKAEIMRVSPFKKWPFAYNRCANYFYQFIIENVMWLSYFKLPSESLFGVMLHILESKRNPTAVYS